MTVTLEGTAAAPANAGHPLDEAPLPFWLDRPCPSWCASLRHTNEDTVRMRVHRGGDRSVALTLEQGHELHDSGDPDVTGYTMKCIDLGLAQHYREAEPHLHFIFACDDETDLTLAEGGALAAILTDLAGRAGDLAAEEEDRPFWLTGPDLAWCAGGHEDGDEPDDRIHHGEYQHVNLTMMDPFAMWPSKTGPEAEWQPQEIQAALEQGWREADARIILQYGDDKYLDLTLAEAGELAGDLSDLIHAAGEEGTG